MKFKLLILLLIVFSACTKKVEKSTLESPEYKDLVGTWTTDYPNDELRKVIIHKNGKVELSKSVERGQRFIINSFTFNQGKIIDNKDTLRNRSLSLYKNGRLFGAIEFYKKMNSDSSLISFFGNTFIKNFTSDTNTYNTIKSVYYVKK